MGIAEDIENYINIEEGMGRVMNNKKIYNKILTKFIDKTYTGPLTEQIEAGDFENAKFSAHTIKGLAANLSLTQLFDVALAYETQIKEGTADMDGLKELVRIHDYTIECVKYVIEQG